jgi:PAS domain S-box-containing protein
VNKQTWQRQTPPNQRTAALEAERAAAASRCGQLEDLLRAHARLSRSAPDLSLDALLHGVLNEARTLTQSDAGLFLLLAEDQRTPALHAWSDRERAICLRPGDPAPAAGPWTECIDARQPVVCNNGASGDGLPPDRRLAVPLFRKDQLVAVLGVGGRERDYDRGDVETTAKLAELAWDMVLHKREEERLQASDERFRRLINHIPAVAVQGYAPDGTVQYWNPASELMYGYSEAEALGRNLVDLIIPPEMRDEVRRNIAAMAATEAAIPASELTLMRRDGTPVAVFSSHAVVRLPGREPELFCVDVDLSERRRVERQCRTHAEFTRRILDSTDAHIAILDARGTIIDVNTAWSQFARNNGSATDRLGVGANYFCRLAPGRNDTLAAEAFEGIRRVQSNDLAFFQLEYPCHTPTRRQWFSMHVLPLQGGGGQVLISHTDITPLKQTEERLASALNEKEVLLREIHHRVKNNLAAVIGLLDMQAQPPLAEDNRGFLIELAGRIRSMALAHEHLYQADSVARIKAQEYFDALITHLRAAFFSAHVDFQVTAPGVETPLDLAVPCGLIVNELVTNALKYAFPNARPCHGRDRCLITVDMRVDNDAHTLIVTDNGVGLPPEFDWTRTQTLGMLLIRMLGQHQLGGTCAFDRQGGTRMILTFSPRKRSAP